MGVGIEERIAGLWRLAKAHSEEFCGPEADLARRRYQAQHPTHIIVFKCMDGRIHIPYATRTPLGVIQPIRNLGGMFHLGWPYLGEVAADSVLEAAAAGKQTLILITYHFSKGDPHRGCAGFNYDKQASIDHVMEIKRQVEHVFGTARQSVYPAVVGFETDQDALILHGQGPPLDLAELVPADEASLPERLRRLYPDMPERVLLDLLPLVRGNMAHVAAVRGAARRLTSEHREWIICVGRGFDFLHEPNMALIVGPYSPDLGVPIRKAADIIAGNMESGRIPDDGFLLLASAPFREGGVDRARAEMKSRFLSDFADAVIAAHRPNLHDRMLRQAAVLRWPARELELI